MTQFDDIKTALDQGDKDKAIALINAYKPGKKKRAKRPDQNPNSLKNLERAPDAGIPKTSKSVFLYSQDLEILEGYAGQGRSVGYLTRQAVHFVAQRLQDGSLTLEQLTGKDDDSRS